MTHFSEPSLFDELRSMEGAWTVVVGAAPTVLSDFELLDSRSGDKKPNVVFLLNSAMTLDDVARGMVGEEGLLYGVAMDWRFRFGPGSEHLDGMFVSERCDPPDARSMVRLTHLGYAGFSRDPRVGVFAGYSVAYVALQLCHFMRCSKVSIAGVPLSYGMSDSAVRIDGSSEMDLHVLGRQRYWMRSGLDALVNEGISVDLPRHVSWAPMN